MPANYAKRKIAGRTFQAHRVIWEEANGPIPDGYVIHHKNGDRFDNRLENLEPLTYGDHSRHHNDKHPRTKACVVCGREFAPVPTKRERAKTCSRDCFVAITRTYRNSAKLTLQQNADIQRRIANGEQQKALAVEYGVSPATITRIKQIPFQ